MRLGDGRLLAPSVTAKRCGARVMLGVGQHTGCRTGSPRRVHVAKTLGTREISERLQIDARSVRLLRGEAAEPGGMHAIALQLRVRTLVRRAQALHRGANVRSVAREAQRSGLSAGDYLAWEREQPTRHEYFRGEVFAMAGGSPRHNALCVRAGAALLAATSDRGCTVFSSDQRIGVGVGERYVYPDVSVVRGKLLLEEGTRDVIANPAILVEVLSGAGAWVYRAATAGQRVTLTDGTALEVDALFAGVFELPGD